MAFYLDPFTERHTEEMMKSLGIMGSIRTESLRAAPMGVSYENKSDHHFKSSRVLGQAFGLLVVSVLANQDVPEATERLEHVNQQLIKYQAVPPTAYYPISEEQTEREIHTAQGNFIFYGREDIDTWIQKVFFKRTGNFFEIKPGDLFNSNVGVSSPLSLDFFIASAINEFARHQNRKMDLQPVVVSPTESMKVVFPNDMNWEKKKTVCILDERPYPIDNLKDIRAGAVHLFPRALIVSAAEKY